MGDAAAEHAAEHREVGRQAERLGGTAAAEPQARDRLVEDEACAGPARQLGDLGDKSRVGRHDAELPGDRIEDDGGDVVADRAEQLAERPGIAPRRHPDEAGRLGGQAGERRLAGATAGGGVDVERLDRAAPVAVEDDEAVAPGLAPAPAERELPGQHLGGGDDPGPELRQHLVELLGQLELGDRVKADRQAERGRAPDGVKDVLVGVAEQVGAAAADQIDVGDVVGVEHPAPLRLGEQDHLFTAPGGEWCQDLGLSQQFVDAEAHLGPMSLARGRPLLKFPFRSPRPRRRRGRRSRRSATSRTAGRGAAVRNGCRRSCRTSGSGSPPRPAVPGRTARSGSGRAARREYGRDRDGRQARPAAGLECRPR
ncbi:MAG: hypothetical protein H6Q02_1088 [Acidobacteria bacterium]|nr:hypothetical protein [Acidobacteriota bacterium]